MANKTTLKIFSYNDINEHIDVVLPKYDIIKSEILNLLKNNPKSLSTTIWNEKVSPLIDRMCSGTIKDNKTPIDFNTKNINRSNKCHNCSFFSRLISNDANIIKIEIGNEIGKELKFSYFLNIHPNIKVINNTISSDNFSNAILSSFVIDDILNKKSSVNLKTGFVCGKTGYLLYDNQDFDSLSTFSNYYITDTDITSNSVSIIIGVLTQLFYILHILKSYNVEYLNITEKSFKFINEEINYTYDGIQISNSIKLVLDSFNGVGIDIESTCTSFYNSEKCSNRLYPKSLLTKSPFNMVKNKHTYISCTGDPFELLKSADVCHNTERTFYEIDPDSISSITNYRSVNSIESGSINIYLYILSMITIPKIYDIFMSNEYLYNYFYNLWIPREYYSVTKKITELHKENNITQIMLYKILTLHKMRSDAVEYSWKYIKRIYN